MTPTFTDDWVYKAEDHEDDWRRWTAHLVGAVRILEIGSYEGRSALLWRRVFPGNLSCVVCLDPFGGTAHGDNYEATFDANTGHDWRIIKWKGRSEQLLLNRDVPFVERFHIVYIDGDHHAEAVKRDAELTWPMLHKGGVMIFDDCGWHDGSNNAEAGADAFLASIEGKYELLGKKRQVAIRRTA
jgi:predicted O-methyltransferase YrrM